MLDPKGDYRALADALDLDHLTLRPDGTDRINPLDSGRGGRDHPQAGRAAMVATIAATVLARPLTALETAVLDWTVDTLAPGATLHQLLDRLAEPSAELAGRAHRDPPP